MERKSLLQKALGIKRNGGDVVAWYEGLTPDERLEFQRQVEQARGAMVASLREFAEAMNQIWLQILENLEPVLSKLIDLYTDSKRKRR